MLPIFSHADRCTIDRPRSLGGLRGWNRDQKSSFSEYDNVAYQIKGNDACNNVVAIILPVDTSSTWGGVKRSFFFLKVVILHIKLRRVEHRTPCNHASTYSVKTRTLGPSGWAKSQNLFSESSHVAYQKGIEHRVLC